LIKDSDPIVSFNALVALNEIKIAEGGIPMSNKLTMYLLKRLEDYNQWGQTTILEYVYKYNPKD
jgi:vesicle coat complex subunit